MAIIRPSGPPGTVRAFFPDILVEDPAKRIAHALEHIAVSLAALDHNVQIMVEQRRNQHGA
jgi:hypothetical protein